MFSKVVFIRVWSIAMIGLGSYFLAAEINGILVTLGNTPLHDLQTRYSIDAFACTSVTCKSLSLISCFAQDNIKRFSDV